MMDLHFHIIQGIDNVANYLEDSLAIARAAAEGITNILATPHYKMNVKQMKRFNK